MKALTCVPVLFLSLVSLIHAQEVPVELPEPSEPPYEVGDLPLKSGYIIKREDAPDLNFRIVNNRMRLYWIDENGLIMEPEVSEVSLRFDERSIRDTVRSYHRLKRLSDDTALGSPYLLIVPHRYYVTLLIKPSGSEELESYRFRYLPAMDEVAPAETD
ncbi:hypothetical protein DDZ13_02180 [Coraliomargarita sinensis]|uniref:Uncharacterized protein n=1 Tax=Coraliomargarita sinensis TaxID=2174842 RepID=A0A317ZQK9_9BACT|nr:hypothetical protein [Coraliomargarita sinensis]PXA05701.1 hypothetical protein DDZ13_02180 [Coraliomargarita sinensis]